MGVWVLWIRGAGGRQEAAGSGGPIAGLVWTPPHPTPTPPRQVLLLSPRVALALPDCRSARTENQVLSLDTHMNLIVRVDVSGWG